MTRRWLIVAITALVLVVTPVAVAARPAAKGEISAADLLSRIQASTAVPWSGFVQTSGALQLPDTDTFTTLAQLLGEDTDLRVWWRADNDWRVDRIRSTGETDLFRQRGFSIRWVFESEAATIAPTTTVRLPDESDFVPPTLARTLLAGAQPGEIFPLPTKRVAGIDAAGLLLVPVADGGTVSGVAVWADPATGLALRVEVYGAGGSRPVLTTEVRDLDLRTPDAATTDFTPPTGVDLRYDDAVDPAAAANRFAPYDLPATLAGLPAAGTDPGAVGVYGHGPTRLLVLPLRGQTSGQLRERLRASATVQETDAGTYAAAGPLGLLLTRRTATSGAFLLAGTLDAATLRRAAADLAGAA